MSNDLKIALREHFDQQELSPEDLQRIRKSASRRFPHWGIMALAAAVLLSVGWFMARPGLVERVSNEIVYNHLKDMPVEFTAGRMEVLRKSLPKLAFHPIHSQYTRSWKLRGGRYCSIQGEIAAQLQFESAGKDRITVYQAPLPNEWQERNGLINQRTTRGVSVHLYAEDGLLIGIARPAATIAK